MQTHGPSCLEGPISGTRPWWQTAETPPDAAERDARAASGAAEEAGLPCDRQAGDDEPFRADLVARVRREIAAGTYDTPEKWDVALARLRKQLENQ
jgi:negative regulator of flagellin synthesis FlgM